MCKFLQQCVEPKKDDWVNHAFTHECHIMTSACVSCNSMASHMNITATYIASYNVTALILLRCCLHHFKSPIDSPFPAHQGGVGASHAGEGDKGDETQAFEVQVYV